MDILSVHEYLKKNKNRSSWNLTNLYFRSAPYKEFVQSFLNMKNYFFNSELNTMIKK